MLLIMRSLLRLLKGFSGFAMSFALAVAASDKLANDFDFPEKKLDSPLLRWFGGRLCYETIKNITLEELSDMIMPTNIIIERERRINR